jgi:hypothetical protein
VDWRERDTEKAGRRESTARPRASTSGQRLRVPNCKRLEFEAEVADRPATGSLQFCYFPNESTNLAQTRPCLGYPSPNRPLLKSVFKKLGNAFVFHYGIMLASQK